MGFHGVDFFISHTVAKLYFTAVQKAMRGARRYDMYTSSKNFFFGDLLLR